ncbi:heterokaryon incompatibility protein [Colletotrichum tofieldiae]|nr:heterokaryon incompatibility protein [Colletotrichum tofieldiae]
MEICDFCQQNVLESDNSWGYHHTDAVKFKNAAESGCVFCRKLLASIGTIDYNGGFKPVYRWSIRETTQIRESRSYVSVTFRPVFSQGHKAKESKMLPEIFFDLYPQDDLGAIPEEESFGLRTDSETSQKQMEAWLKNCVDNHPKCKARHASSDFVPTRVLDLGAPDGPWPPLCIRIVQTDGKTIGGESTRYMTLSHCWGKEKFVQLTAVKLTDFITNGIPWKSPYDHNGVEASPHNDIHSNKNFLDAIEITRKLGIRYIWIDSICIIQDNEEDWNVEAKLMHKVYRNSYCNLAAADSKNCHGGLYRNRTSDALPVKYSPKTSSLRFSGRDWLVLSSDLWDKVLLGSPLYTRGWVFQGKDPRHLSKNRLNKYQNVVRRPNGLDAKKEGPSPAEAKEENPFPHWSWTYLDVPIQVVPRFRGNPRFYVATNHEGGKVGFQFKKPFQWRLKRENVPVEKQELGHLAPKLGNSEGSGKAQDTVVVGGPPDPAGKVWPPDERSELGTQEIEIQAHICKGALRFVAEKERWVVVVDGIQSDAVIEAFPDTEPAQDEAQCEFLLLAASRVFIDKLGHEIKDCDEEDDIQYDEIEENTVEECNGGEDAVEDDGYEDIKYSGVGILVERNDYRLKRTGAVTFRQLCFNDWRHFRSACGEKEFIDDELRVKRGQMVTLI